MLFTKQVEIEKTKRRSKVDTNLFTFLFIQLHINHISIQVKMSNHFEEIPKKKLTLEECAFFNKATNDYINKLITIDPVLAAIMKISILDADDDKYKQSFQGTQEMLDTNNSSQLEEDPSKFKPSGFSRPVNVPSRLAAWLNIESNSKMPPLSLHSLVVNQLKTRNMQVTPGVYHIDQETADLFDVNMEAANKASTRKDPSGFNMFNIAMHTKAALKKN
jgi:hypothetical protein